VKFLIFSFLFSAVRSPRIEFLTLARVTRFLLFPIQPRVCRLNVGRKAPLGPLLCAFDVQQNAIARIESEGFGKKTAIRRHNEGARSEKVQQRTSMLLIHFKSTTTTHCIYHKNFPLTFAVKHNFSVAGARGGRRRIKKL
jgi:hypothetical protein